MKVFLFFTLYLFLFLSGFGQVNYSTKSKKAIKYYEDAQVLLKQRRVNEAIREFNRALEKDNDFIEAHLRLALAYELIREIEAQQYHLEQIVKIEPESDRFKNVRYSLGKIYYNQGHYEMSKKQLIKLEEFGIDNSRIKEDVERLTINLDFAILNVNNPIDIEPKPMSGVLNAFPLQYFPVLTADGNSIIYTVIF